MDEGEKGYALNERVRRIFHSAGFETVPRDKGGKEEEVTLSSGKKRTIDVVAIDKGLGIKIIACCKARKKLPEPLTAYVNDYKEIKKFSKANKVSFVVTEKKVEEADKNYIHDSEMVLWTEKELDYYEALVNAIGAYAKYEIIHSFGLKTEEEKDTHHVLALRFPQPGIGSDTDVFIFSISPERLLKTAAVYRRARGEGYTYQRVLRRTRLPKIGKFVSTKDALLPTDIVISLGSKVSYDRIKMDKLMDEKGQEIFLSRERVVELVRLNIPMEYASLEIIDGQHRLFGFIKAPVERRENFNLVVAGIKKGTKELPPEKRKDLFVSINDTSRRMDPNLVSYLKYTDDEEECKKDPELMAIKTVVELNKAAPFENKIRLLDVSKGEKITLKGFSGYDLKGLVGAKGTLKKFYPKNLSSEYVRVLRLYFSIIRNLFEEEWRDPKKYIIATNRGITAFLKLLKPLLETTKGKLTHENITKYLSPLKGFPWSFDKLQSDYVGSKGWIRFYDDLFKKIKNEYSEFGEKLD